MRDEIYQIADELRAMANTGLMFAANGYDKERYEKMLHASARLVAAVDGEPAEEIYAQYLDNLAHAGPLLCVETIVLRDEKILLIQRRDDQTWAVPGGLAEVGETLAGAAVRELWEEAGVRAEARQLLAIYDSRLWPARTRMHLCVAQFLMQTDETPAVRLEEPYIPSPLTECLDAGFFNLAELASLELHPGHAERIPRAFKLARGEMSIPYFDR